MEINRTQSMCLRSLVAARAPFMFAATRSNINKHYRRMTLFETFVCFRLCCLILQNNFQLMASPSPSLIAALIILIASSYTLTRFSYIYCITAITYILSNVLNCWFTFFTTISHLLACLSKIFPFNVMYDKKICIFSWEIFMSMNSRDITSS